MIVWLDSKDHNRPIISFPGTDITKGRDWISDFHIATGTEHFDKRFRDAKNSIEKIRKETRMEPTLVSHSLGASINEYVGRFYPNIKQININKGAGLSSIGKPKQPNQTDIHIVGDFVSCLSYCNSCIPTGRRINLFPRRINIFRCCGQHRVDNITQLSGKL